MKTWIGKQLRSARSLLFGQPKDDSLETFFRTSVDMFAVASIDGYFKRLNPAFESVLGYTMEELQARPFLDFIHPDDRANTIRAVTAAEPEDFLYGVENRYICKDGSLRWLSWKWTLVGDLLYATARDITDLRNTQAEGKKDADRLRSIIQLQLELAEGGTDSDRLMALIVDKAERFTESRGAVIEIADGDDMVYRAASGAAAKTVGLKIKRAGSLSGLCYQTGAIQLCEDSHVDPRVDRAACERIGARSMVLVPLWHSQKIVGVLKVFSAEARYYGPKQTALLELLSGFLGAMLDRAAHADALKQSEQEVRSLNDQLEKKVAERTRELRDSHERFRVVTESIDDVLWLATPDRSQMLYVSPAYERVWGFSCEALMQNPRAYADVIHPEDRERMLATAARSALGPATHEFRLIRKDGSVRWMRSRTFPNRNDQGEVYRIAGVVTDITETREAVLAERAAVEASRLKSEFLANMSHEIRTPINGVMGMANLLLDTGLGDEQKEYAGNIVGSAEILLTLVNDILDLSKAEAGKIELEEIDFDLRQIVSDVEKTVSYAATKKGLALKVAIAPGTPEFLRGDPTRLRQVLMNLTSNAIKFTAEGHVQIAVRSEPEAAGYRLRFAVEDTGVGIPCSAREKMFQPFSQVDASTTRRFGGTGLGLSISKRLVDLMHGEIGVNSEEGQGSVFWFSLSLSEGRGAVRAPAASARFAAEPTRKCRVLLAEDNTVNQLIARKILQKMGHSVVTVSNGAEAIDALRLAPYDVVLMDCQMPEMDGFEATRLIREGRVEHGASQPIIALTANAMAGDRERCFEAGMNDYVTKPVRAEELAAAIERVMGASGRRLVG